MKTKKIMLYLLILIVVIGLIFLIGKINLANKFNKEVTQLFAESRNISAKQFTFKQLEGLPEPVERYFRHVLKDGQPYISYVRLTHNGQFKTDLKKD